MQFRINPILTNDLMVFFAMAMTGNDSQELLILSSSKDKTILGIINHFMRTLVVIKDSSSALQCLWQARLHCLSGD